MDPSRDCEGHETRGGIGLASPWSCRGAPAWAPPKTSRNRTSSGRTHRSAPTEHASRGSPVQNIPEKVWPLGRRLGLSNPKTARAMKHAGTLGWQALGPVGAHRCVRPQKPPATGRLRGGHIGPPLQNMLPGVRPYRTLRHGFAVCMRVGLWADTQVRPSRGNTHQASSHDTICMASSPVLVLGLVL